MIFEPGQTVSEIAIRYPASVRIFETLGIDYCCGGKHPLPEACEKANVPVTKLMQMLNELETSAGQEERPWNDAPLAELTTHIVQRHHLYVRNEAPRLEALIEKVVHRHGAAHLELETIRDLFHDLAKELTAHMMKEERILFPFIEQMEIGRQSGGTSPSGCFPSVEFPISRMIAEHDDAGELTAKIRALSGGLQPPPDACPSYRALYHGLEQFERDLHQHVHLENNILFPRAVALERSLLEAAPPKRSW